MELSDDAWGHVGLHLKPRHLSKLMRTCKRVRLAVDTDRYWTRAAAHLVWRGSEYMELHSREFPSADDLLPPVDEAYNLYYLVGLDRGYYHGMEMFLRRIQETISVYGRVPGYQGGWWAEFHGVEGLRNRTVKLYVETAAPCWFGTKLPKLEGDEDRIDMKEMARRVTILDWVQSKTGQRSEWPRMRKFVCDLEDDPMPAVYKRRIFRKLHKLVWALMDAETGDELPTSVVAGDICIF